MNHYTTHNKPIVIANLLLESQEKNTLNSFLIFEANSMLASTLTTWLAETILLLPVTVFMIFKVMTRILSNINNFLNYIKKFI